MSRTKEVAVGSGNLPFEVKFVNPNGTFTSDGYGGADDTAAVDVIENVPAKIEPAGKNRMFEAEQVRGEIDAIVTVRWDSDVAAIDFIKDDIRVEDELDGRIFRVVRVHKPGFRDGKIVLGCKELPADG